MSTLPGNPHYDLAGESIRASWPKTDTDPLHLQAAQVEATLALAFEQRTANLIALHQFGLSLYMDGKVTDSPEEFLGDMGRLDVQIVERIGLDGDTK